MVTKFAGQILATKFGFEPDCSIGGELWHEQTQKGVNFDFEV